MTKRLLEIEIDCGDTTCASVPGVFCQMVRTSKFGTRFHCGLYDNQELKRDDKDWLTRCQECLDAEIGS